MANVVMTMSSRVYAHFPYSTAWPPEVVERYVRLNTEKKTDTGVYSADWGERKKEWPKLLKPDNVVPLDKDSSVDMRPD